MILDIYCIFILESDTFDMISPQMPRRDSSVAYFVDIILKLMALQASLVLQKLSYSFLKLKKYEYHLPFENLCTF